MKKGILVFDLCSSTEIVEYLSKVSAMGEYVSLMNKFDNLLNILRKYFDFTKYKFIGDGFILIIENIDPLEDVLLLSKIINDIGKSMINEFIETFISEKPRRIGLTFGYDVGELFSFSLDSIDEFSGRPLNLASRLQSSLEAIEDAGKILFSLEAKQLIFSRKKITEKNKKSRTFKNISDNKPLTCFMYDLNPDDIFSFVKRNIIPKQKPIGNEKIEEISESNKEYIIKKLEELEYGYYTGHN
jgi:hypothetical protein